MKKHTIARPRGTAAPPGPADMAPAAGAADGAGADTAGGAAGAGKPTRKGRETDEAFRAAARKVDETIRKLPGFDSVRLLDAWLDRFHDGGRNGDRND